MPDGWLIAERAAIYERDRLDPVEPSPAFDEFVHGRRRRALSGAVPLHGVSSRACSRAVRWRR